MHNTVQMRFQLPLDAPVKLVEDIQHYSALIELQAKMRTAAPWFEQLA